MLLWLCSCGTQKSVTESPSATLPDAEWQDLYVPVTFDLRSPKNLSLSGRATMIRNERITISLRFLGMEVAVLDVTPREVTAIDRYHKMWMSENIETFLHDHDITLTDLQDLLIGRASDRVLKKLDSTPINLMYGPMVATPEGSLTRYVIVTAGIASLPIEFELAYKPDKAEWNTGRTPNISIPSSYRQINPRSLLENLPTDR